MARTLLITLLTMATAAILPARSANTAELTLEKALQMPPLELAQACSSLDRQRGFLRLAETGVNVVIDGRAVKKRDAPKALADLDAREKICADALARRGMAPLDGAWIGEASNCNEVGTPLPQLLGAHDTLVTIDQTRSKVVFTLHGRWKDRDVNVPMPAAMVESAIVAVDPGNEDYPWRGELKDGVVTLQPDSARVLAAWPQWAGPPKRAALDACRLLIMPVALRAGPAYAGIDAARARQLQHDLLSGPPEATTAAIAVVLREPHLFPPPVLGALAEAQFGSGNKADGTFWYHAARLRARADSLRSTDPTTFKAVEALFPPFNDIGLYAIEQLSTADALLARLVAWDRDTPVAYDVRWVNLYGQVAMQAARSGGRPVTDPLTLPADRLAAVAEQARRDYEQSFLDMLGRERARQAIATWAWELVVTNKFSGTKFHVDFSTLRVDGSLRRVWEVRDLGHKSSSGASSFLCENEYDCSGRRYRELYFSSHAGQMGLGQRIGKSLTTDEWSEFGKDFDADAPAEKIRQAVCARPAPPQR